MQWSGPNIQVPLCVCNKNEKKTKLPGNNSWKVPIWHFILYEWLFLGKIQFATPSNIPKYNFWLLKLFLKELGCFFSLKTFNLFYNKYSLWIFSFFPVKTIQYQVSTFDKMLFGVSPVLRVLFLMVTRASFCRSRIWHLISKRNKILYI